MAAEARAVPLLGRKPPGDLLGEAARLSDVLPHLAVEARQVSAQLQLGIHGRRRPGPGEEFWEFRPFSSGESASRIDWRRSARDDRLYVREREWESASAYWLWFDLSPSMRFVSRLAERAKRDRALLMGLAAADMLVHAGERVGLLGATPPMASRNIVLRLADALLARPEPAEATDGTPPPTRLRRRDHVLLFGDFIAPMGEIEEALARIAHAGAQATLVLIRDPVEETFPFTGELEFEDLEGDANWRVGEAEEIAVRYRERIAAANAELRRLALRFGFGFLRHRTDRPAADTLLGLAALFGGRAPAPSLGERA